MKKDAALLLLKYLENKCSRDDLESIIHLIGTKKNDGELQTLLFEYWKNTTSFQHRIAKDELSQILDSVHHRINLHKTGNLTVIKRITHYATRIAAILFVPLLISSILMLYDDGVYDQTDTYITLETPMGSKLKTVLPDGTEVWQNAGTTLQYPAEFTKRNREVILNGEAYFHVTSDMKNPFYVKTADGTIKVTGTKFNVSAFPDDKFSSVVLEEGKVSYTPAKKGKEPVALLPEEQIVFIKESGSLTKQKTDVEKYISWTKGKLIFRNDPLSEIITRLQRWYNADITLSDPNRTLGTLTFTMTIKNETLTQVLEYLSQAANLNLEKEDISRNTSEGLGRTKYILTKINK
jgi:ferric-dicitrate binding protein FerR (iron transport regulator)